MRPVEKETVYEIYSMARRLGGDYAKSLQIEYHDCDLSGIDLSEAKCLCEQSPTYGR